VKKVDAVDDEFQCMGPPMLKLSLILPDFLVLTVVVTRAVVGVGCGGYIGNY
jgi:hypothetical protein